MPSIDDAVAFVHLVNRDPALQEQLAALRPRAWTRLFALAAEHGFDLDHETFYHACLSDRVDRFCAALARVAGPLFLYKM